MVSRLTRSFRCLNHPDNLAQSPPCADVFSDEDNIDPAMVVAITPLIRKLISWLGQ